MSYNPYYAPYYRPMNYYNPSMPQEQNTQMPVQQQMQPVQQIPMVQPTQPNDMIWVLSEVEAQSYPVAPNNSVILWDKNNDVVYIKSVNMQGVPSMRILEYKERTAENANKGSEKHECQCGNKFVSIDKFEALQGEFKALRGELEKLKANPKSKPTKKVVEEEESDAE